MTCAPIRNLFGESYGSAVAQALLRDDPEAIRSIVLDAVLPPDYPFSGVDRGENALRSIDALADGCAAQPECHGTYGDVRVLIAEAAAILDAEPHEVTVPDLESDADHIVRLDGGDWYASAGPNAVLRWPEAMTVSVSCADRQGISYTSCGRMIRNAFIDDPTVAPDVSCVATMPPMP